MSYKVSELYTIERKPGIAIRGKRHPKQETDTWAYFLADTPPATIAAAAKKLRANASNISSATVYAVVISNPNQVINAPEVEGVYGNLDDAQGYINGRQKYQNYVLGMMQAASERETMLGYRLMAYAANQR